MLISYFACCCALWGCLKKAQGLNFIKDHLLGIFGNINLKCDSSKPHQVLNVRVCGCVVWNLGPSPEFYELKNHNQCYCQLNFWQKEFPFVRSKPGNLPISGNSVVVVKVQSNSRPDPIPNELIRNIRQRRFNDAELFLWNLFWVLYFKHILHVIIFSEQDVKGQFSIFRGS